jgi:hypothetical protein
MISPLTLASVGKTKRERLEAAMKRIIMLAIVAMAVSFALQSSAKKTDVVRAMGGQTMQPTGLSIDASYDPRLDKLVPGYKVINVVLVNNSFNILPFDPQKDEWSIRLADDMRLHKVIHNLRNEDPAAWNALPEKAKDLIGYPMVLPVGGKEVFDLFVPDKVDVSRFTELRAHIKPLNTKFEVMVSQ